MLRSRSVSFLLLLALLSTFLPPSSQEWAPLAARTADAQEKPAGRGDIPAERGSLRFAPAIDLDGDEASNPTASASVPVIRHSVPGAVADHPLHYAEIRLGVEVVPEHDWQNPAGSEVTFRLWNTETGLDMSETAAADAWGAVAAGFALNYDQLEGQFAYQASSPAFGATPVRTFRIDPASASQETIYGGARISSRLESDGRLVVDIRSEHVIDDSALAAQVSVVRLVAQAGTAAPALEELPTLIAERIDDHHARASIYLDGGSYALLGEVTAGSVAARSRAEVVEVPARPAPPIVSIDEIAPLDETQALVAYRTVDNHAAMRRLALADLPPNLPQTFTANVAHSRTRVGAFQWQDTTYSIAPANPATDEGGLALGGLRYDPVLRRYDFAIVTLDGARREQTLTVEVLGPNGVVIHEESTPAVLQPGTPLEHGVTVPADLGEPYGLRVRLPGLDQSADLRPAGAQGVAAGSPTAPHGDDDAGWFITKLKELAETSFQSLVGGIMFLKQYGTFKVNFELAAKFLEVNLATIGVECTLLTGQCKASDPKGLFFEENVVNMTQIVFDGLQDFWIKNFSSVDFNAFIESGLEVGSLEGVMKLDANLEIPLFTPGKCPDPRAEELAKAYVKALGENLRDLAILSNVAGKEILEKAESAINKFAIPLVPNVPVQLRLRAIMSFQLEAGSSGDYNITLDAFLQMGLKAALVLNLAMMDLLKYLLLIVDMVDLGRAIYGITNLYEMLSQLIDIYKSASRFTSDKQCNPPPPPERLPDDRRDAPQGPVDPYPTGLSGNLYFAQQQIAGAERLSLGRAATYWRLEARRLEMADHVNDTAARTAQAAETEADYEAARFQIQGLLSGTIPLQTGQTITQAVHLAYGQFEYNLSHTDYEIKSRTLQGALDFAQRDYDLLRGQELELQHELRVLDQRGGVGVLDSGLAGRTMLSLGAFGLTATPIKLMPGVSNTGVRGARVHTPYSAPPVLIIPSGGLYGYTESDQAKAWLEAYVASGGTLIALAQADGVDWEVLPGGQVRGLGYSEDIFCNQASVRVVNDSPWLAGINRDLPDIQIDGSFTAWPAEASVILLRTTGNQMPAMIEYPFGNGTVIATAAYPDFVMNGLQSPEDVVFASSLFSVAYLRATGQTLAASAGPGQPLSLPATVRNTTALSASLLTVWNNYYDYQAINSWRWAKALPAALVMSRTLALQPPLQSGETRTINLAFAAPNSAGIFRANYFLGDVGEWSRSQAIPGPLYRIERSGPPLQPLALSLVRDRDEYAYGSTATVTATLRNNGAASRTLALVPGAGLASPPLTVTLAPGQTVSQAYQTTVTAAVTARLEVREAGSVVNRQVVPLLLRAPILGLDVSPERAISGLATTARLTATLSDDRAPSVTWEVRRNGDLLASFSSATAADGEFHTATASVELPAAAAGDRFTVRLGLPQTGEAMTQTVTVGEPATITGASLIAPVTMGQPNPAALRVRLQDQGRPGAAQVRALVEEYGQVIAAGPPRSVELGERAHELLIDLPIPGALDFFGSYSIVVSMTGQISGTDRAFSSSRSIDFPAMNPRTTLDTITFAAGDPLRVGVGQLPGSVILPDSGPYTLTLMPYDSSFSTPVVVPATTVISGQRVLAATVPDLPAGGNYFLNVETARLPGWIDTQRLFVRPQRFEYAVDPGATAGGGLEWRATNVGGVDSRLEGSLTLIDAQDQVIASAAISMSAPIGVARAATLAVPDQVGDGAYTLRWSGADHEGGDLFSEWPVTISGGFGLSADTDQPRYRLGDTVRAGGLITAGAALDDAWLRLEVVEQREQAPAMVSTLAGNTWVSDGVGPAAAVLGIDIAWSHDRTFALMIESGAIRRLDLASRAVTTLIEDRYAPTGSPLDRMSSIDLSSDDSFAIIGAQSCLLRFDLGSGELSVVAGACGVEGNGNPATDDGIGAAARFWGELSVDLSADDSFALVRESQGYLLRQVTLANRRVTTVGQVPLNFHYMFGMPSLALSSDDSFAVLTNGASQVIRFDLNSRAFSPLAGTTQRGSADGPGSLARFQEVSGVAILPDSSGALLLDNTNMTIRHLALSAPYTVTTQYGGLGERLHRDGSGLNSRFANFPLSNGIAIDPAGTTALLTSLETVRRIELGDRRVSTIAGAPDGADGVGGAARFNEPWAIALSRDGAFALVADTKNHTLRRIDTASGAVSTVAGQLGQPGATDGISGTALLNHPVGVAVSPDSTFALVADDGTGGNYNYAIRRVELASGAISTLAGGPTPGSADGPGGSAQFECMQELAISGAGAFALIADECNHTIRRLELTSPYTVTTIAGLAQANGTADGPGADARFLYPQSVAISPDSTFALVADANHTIRRVELAPPYAVSTVAGLAGQYGFVDASGSLARFDDPVSISFAGATLALIADRSNHAVRQLDLASGAVTTVAGRPLSGRVDGLAIDARFREPSSVAASADGSFALILEESYNYLAGQNDVRRLDLGSQPQVLDTRWVPVSGAGSFGYTLPFTAPDLLAHPAARGQLRLRATLFGDEPAAAPREGRRQLATAAALFTVAEPGQSLEIYPEQPAYRTNLPGTALDDAAAAVRLNGTAWNDSAVASDLSLTVASSDGRQVHAQSWPAVPPGAARTFSLVDAAPPAGQISYTARLTPAATASATVMIRPGQIQASAAITPTAVVSGQAALQQVNLRNLGGVTGYVRAAFGGAEREVLIAPGAAVTLSAPVTPTGNGPVTLPVSLTGDLERTLEPAVQVQDQSVIMDLYLGDTEIDPGSMAQTASADFYVYLKSASASSFDAQLSYTLTGPIARSGGTLTHIMPVGGWDQIALGQLETGDYTLSISLINPRLGIELSRLERSFSVVPVRRVLELDASASPPDSSGIITLTVGLTNTLESNVTTDGKLVLSGLTEQERWVMLYPGVALSDIIGGGEAAPEPLDPINVAGLSGVQEVLIEYQAEDGTVMASYRLAIDLQPRLAPLVELVALEAAPASAGATAALSITLRNNGASGEAPLTLTAFDQSFSVLVAAPGGQTSEVTQAVPVPATLLAGTYPVVAQLGAQEQRADVTVAGPEITLGLATDKEHYAPRSAVAWTATVESNGPPALYDVVLRYGGAEYTRTVSLQAGAPVDVPWTFTAGAVSDYATAIVRSHAGGSGGQALAIDTSQIKVIEDPAAWLESDSDRYEAGEVVRLTLHLGAPARSAAVFAPNDLDGPLGLQLWSSVAVAAGEAISGSYTLAYTLPATLATGRYAFRYTVDGEERSLPVDLFGVTLSAEPLAIEEGANPATALSRAQAGIPITVSTRLRSNRQVDAVLRAYALDGSGGYHSLGAAATLTTTLEPGATPVTLAGVLLPQSAEAYQIVVNAYSADGGRLLGGGSAYVDVGSALLTGLSTDHGVYRSGQAGVGTVAVYGTQTATVEVRTSAGALLLNRTLPLTGYAALTFSLPTATPRDEVLTATITDSRGLASTRQAAYRVADAFDTTAPGLAVLSPADGARLIVNGSGAVVTVSGVVTETNAVAVLVNGAPASVSAGRWSINLPLSLGANVLDLTAVDQAGNVGIGAPHLITLEPGYGVSLSAAPLTAQPGATITFQAVVTSSAPLTATVIFPISLAAIDPESGNASSGVLTVTDTVVWRGRVAPGAPVTIQWTGRALGPGEYRLQAAVQASGMSLHKSRQQTLLISAAPTQRKLYLPFIKR